MFEKRKVKKVIEQQLRKRTGDVNDYITRREIASDIMATCMIRHGIAVNVVCNQINNSEADINNHQLTVDVNVETGYHIISTIGPNGKVIHKEFKIRKVK